MSIENHSRYQILKKKICLNTLMYIHIYNEIIESSINNENMMDNKSKLSYIMYIQKKIK